MSNVYCKLVADAEVALAGFLAQSDPELKKYRKLVAVAYGVNITDRFIRKVKAGEW